MQTRRFLLLGVLLMASGGASADDADEGRSVLDGFLDNVTTMSGRFEQQLVDASGDVVESAAGSLAVERPGRFRWTYSEPYRQELVADGRNVWNYDVDLDQVTVSPQQEALGSTPAALLGGTRDVLDTFDYLGSESDRGTVWVRLAPRNAESGINRVELGFTQGQLSRMVFMDNLDQSTLIALFDMSFNQPIEPGLLEFEPPEGVDIVGSTAIVAPPPD